MYVHLDMSCHEQQRFVISDLHYVMPDIQISLAQVENLFYSHICESA